MQGRFDKGIRASSLVGMENAAYGSGDLGMLMQHWKQKLRLGHALGASVRFVELGSSAWGAFQQQSRGRKLPHGKQVILIVRSRLRCQSLTAP